MTRSIPTIASLAIALSVATAAAGETKMTGAEIARAFTGNTVHGMWGSTEYRSYFDANGTTIYATQRGQDVGRWSVKGDQYCSIWQQSGESCYDILREGERIIWVVPSSGKRYDSTLVAGKALTF